METSSPDRDRLSHPDEPPPIQRGGWVALGWGLACAICASGTWISGFLLLNARIKVPNFELQDRLPDIALTIAFVAAVGGILGGCIVGLIHLTPSRTPLLLALYGGATGALGGVVTIPVVIWCREWLSPLASTTCLWGIVGFLAGVAAHRLSRCVATSSKAIGPGSVRDRLISGLLLLLAIFLFLCLLAPLLTTRY